MNMISQPDRYQSHGLEGLEATLHSPVSSQISFPSSHALFWSPEEWLLQTAPPGVFDVILLAQLQWVGSPGSSVDGRQSLCHLFGCLGRVSGHSWVVQTSSPDQLMAQLPPGSPASPHCFLPPPPSSHLSKGWPYWLALLPCFFSPLGTLSGVPTRFIPLSYSA